MPRTKGSTNANLFQRHIEVLAVLPMEPDTLTVAEVAERLAGESEGGNERGLRSRNRHLERIQDALDALVPMFRLYRSPRPGGRARYAWRRDAIAARKAAIALRSALILSEP